MPEQRFKVYPRGFLGAVLAPRAVKVQGLSESNRGFSMVERTAMVNQNQFDVPNPTVEEIYNTYILDREKAKSFEFRESVLRCAMNTFGAYNFRQWFEAQYQNPSAGDLHGRFLLDTLQFLETGQRNMSIENWAAIIVIDSSMEPLGKLPEKAREFFGLGSKYQRDCDWPTIIQCWCGMPSGLEDLIGSLHVLFGAPAVK
jgi:hypothetical protein